MKKFIIGFLVGGIVLVSLTYIFIGQNQNDILDSKREKNDELFVYETEVDSASDCSSFEKYDEEKNICYFECETELQCTNIQNDIEKELDGWTEELQKDKDPVEEKSIPENDKSSEAEYRVAVGEILNFESGKDDENFRKIWSEISALSPDSLSDKYIEKYQVFDNKDDDTLAFVDDEDGNGKWRVAVNLSGYNTSTNKENKATFIHELGHIISLNFLQVHPNVNEEKCNGFYIEEGCANINSYLNNFQKKFWVNLKKNADGSAEFDENKFVTDYASTNEVEDFAESFAFFVLSNEREIGDQIKDQKIKSMYNFSELVEIRNSMRKTLSADIIRARKI